MAGQHACMKIKFACKISQHVATLSYMKYNLFAAFKLAPDSYPHAYSIIIIETVP